MAFSKIRLPMKHWADCSTWPRHDTDRARRVADFLLAWENAEENGRWDSTDLWNVDAVIATTCLPFSG